MVYQDNYKTIKDKEPNFFIIYTNNVFKNSDFAETNPLKPLVP